MIANVLFYTAYEGGFWLPWPFSPDNKPSNPELLTCKLEPHGLYVWHEHSLGRPFAFHSLQFDNGREWDAVNGWRDGLGSN